MFLDDQVTAVRRSQTGFWCSPAFKDKDGFTNVLIIIGVFVSAEKMLLLLFNNVGNFHLFISYLLQLLIYTGASF